MSQLDFRKKISQNKNRISKIVLPFQNIETINESNKERQIFLDLYSKGEDTWRNRLIWGDKKYILPSLLAEFQNKIKLIYIDPPFDTQADFSLKTKIPDNPLTKVDETTVFIKEPNIIEQKAYRDTWSVSNQEKERGATHLDKYLSWFYETIFYCKELLSEDGNIYVHLDHHIVHYAKVVMDEVFGNENFQREIIWSYDTKSGYKAAVNNWVRSHDTILYYSKSNKLKKFNKEYEPYTAEYIQRFKKKDKDGRLFRDDRGRGRKAQYLDEYKGIPITDVWTGIMSFQQSSTSKEYLNYPTQKPEKLLERIIKSSSDEGDIVADFFCGTGTTLAAAEKLNRKWIGSDLGKFSIHITKKRLLDISDVSPFNVQNLGKYERQKWIESEFADPKKRILKELSYKKFIIEMYQGEIIDGHIWINGIKNDRLIHIGPVDSPITISDIKSIIQEFWKIVSIDKKIITNGLDILGWDFAFDVNETAKQFAEMNKINISFKKIPNEILDSEARRQGDIHFYELASLDVDLKIDKEKLKVKIKNFIIPTDDIPQEAKKSINHWLQYIDYWAIDWDHKNDTFHNQWQSFRTREKPKLELLAEHNYKNKGDYTAVVKIVDILGNDTTKSFKIKIK